MVREFNSYIVSVLHGSTVRTENTESRKQCLGVSSAGDTKVQPMAAGKHIATSGGSPLTFGPEDMIKIGGRLPLMLISS